MSRNLPARRSSQTAVAAANQAVVSPTVARAEGAGASYQAVAQATAMAIQDATDYLRNVAVIAATTVGVASAQMIETESPSPWAEIISVAQQTVNTAAATFATVGQNAGTVLTNYPSG